MNQSQRKIGYQCAFAIVAAAMIITPARAQQANIRSVTFYVVTPGRLGDFEAAIKEYNAILAKGESSRYYSMWQSLTGANEFARATSYTNWADLDAGPDPKMKEQAAELRGISTRIIQCTERWHTVIDEVLPDLSLPQTAETPKMIRVLRTRVRPEKVNEYMALVKSEVLPAAKKAGVKSYTVSQERYGAPNTEFVSISGLNNWADLDGGLWIQKAMGEEGYQRFLLKLRTLTVEAEATMYRFVPESSYLPAAK